MALSASVRTFSGETIAQRVGVDFNGLCAAAAARRYCFLGNVDSYDDTVFNRLQVAVVVAELQALVATLPASQREAAQVVLEFSELVDLKPHRYLVFAGD